MHRARSLTWFSLVLASLACSPAEPKSSDTSVATNDELGDGDGEAESSSSASESSSSDSETTTSESGDPSSSESGTKFDLGMQADLPALELVPVKDLPGLESITFYERTGGVAPDPFTFTVDGPELTVRLDDPLAFANFDIDGASGEFYDVYYSNELGEFQLDGSYLTISGTFAQTLPAGGGLNLAEISLNFTDATSEYGNYVASFVALGDNAHPENVNLAIDGDLQTHTTMGNTVGANERLRVTLGFESTSGPPK